MDTEALKNTLRLITTDHSEAICQEDFNVKYGYPEKPVLFSSAFKNWHIKSDWSLDFLKKNLPEAEHIESGQEKLPPKAMTLEQYLESDRLSSHYFKSQQHLDNNRFEVDYMPREIFTCWYSQYPRSKPKKQLSWLYIGGRHTGTDIHRDIWGTSAWNYLISGKKLWFIYPKAYLNLIRKNKEAFTIKRIQEDLANQDLASIYKPLYCIQKAGQLLFVPNNCYHATINLDFSVALTENFMNETNYDNVRSFFRSGTNRKNISDIESIISHGFKLMNPQNKETYEGKN